jgi:hypothetical protein
VSSSIRLEPGDVQVCSLPVERCECGEQVTHEVRIDLRAVGVESPVLRACHRCANEMAESIRQSLKPAGGRT